MSPFITSKTKVIFDYLHILKDKMQNLVPRRINMDWVFVFQGLKGDRGEPGLPGTQGFAGLPV